MAVKRAFDTPTTRRLSAAALLLTVALLTSAAWAHAEDDEDEDQGPAARSASLTLRYDARGAAGEVTSLSLKSVYAFKGFLKSTFWILFLAVAVGTAFSIPSLWYVCNVILLLRVIEAIPRVFFEKPRYAMQSKAVAAASGRV